MSTRKRCCAKSSEVFIAVAGGDFFRPALRVAATRSDKWPGNGRRNRETAFKGAHKSAITGLS